MAPVKKSVFELFSSLHMLRGTYTIEFYLPVEKFQTTNRNKQVKKVQVKLYVILFLSVPDK